MEDLYVLLIIIGSFGITYWLVQIYAVFIASKKE